MFPHQKSEFRAAIAREAATWLKTPFQMDCGIKGVGVDCFRFIEGVYRNAGIVDVKLSEFAGFPTDWFLHCRDEVYKDGLDKYCHPVTEQQVDLGDIVLFKFGRVHSHAAIIFRWPSLLMHSWRNGVEWIDGSRTPLANREPLLYSPFPPV